MKTLLITGATGFIGRHLIEKATKDGFRVIASVRKQSNTNYLKKLNIPTVILSLDDPDSLLEEINNIHSTHGKIDVLIHNAGITQSLYNNDYYEINTKLTKNLIDAILCSQCKTLKFIYVSSISANGPGDPNSCKPIMEGDIPHPVTHYGRSKLMAENHITNQKELQWIIVRPTAVYGEREKNILNIIVSINSGLEVYLGSKNQVLSFIHVSDLVSSLLKSASNEVSGQVFNLSDGSSYPIVEVNRIIKSHLKKRTLKLVFPISLIRIIAAMFEVVGHITNSSPILNRDKIHELVEINWTCDNSKITNEINYIPRLKFDEGIAHTIDWYKNNGRL